MMLKALIHSRLLALISSFGSNLRGKKGMTKGKMLLIALLFIYVIGVFAFMFFGSFVSLAEPLYMVRLGWFFFALCAILSFALMFFFSIFTAKAQLYEARDNDLLLAMPIPPGNILLSRMLMLYLQNLVFGLIVSIPALVAWCLNCPITPVGVAVFVAFCRVMPLFALAFSSLFGWLLHLATARVRRKSLFTTVASLVFLALYFYVISSANSLVASIAANSGALADGVSAVRPLYWLGIAIAEGEIVSGLLGLAVLLVPFIIAYVILSKTFIRTATANRGSAKVKYTERAVKPQSPQRALLRRELGRFTSSPAYLLNSGIGVIMLIIAAVAILIKRKDILTIFGLMEGVEFMISSIVILSVCLLCTTITICAASVSIEGKNIWITKSLPVSTRDILSAKLRLQVVITLPAVILAQAAVIYVFRPEGLMLLCAIVLPLVFCLLSACFGLWCNLRHCNLNWTNEAQVVKNGVAVMLTMFGGMGIVVAPLVLILVLARSAFIADIVLGFYTLAVILLTLLFYRLDMGRGVKLYEKL